MGHFLLLLVDIAEELRKGSRLEKKEKIEEEVENVLLIAQ